MMEIVLTDNNIPCAVMIYYVSTSTIFNLLPNYEAGKKQSCYDQKLVNHFLGHVHTKIYSSTFSLSIQFRSAHTDLED